MSFFRDGVLVLLQVLAAADAGIRSHAQPLLERHPQQPLGVAGRRADAPDELAGVGTVGRRGCRSGARDERQQPGENREQHTDPGTQRPPGLLHLPPSGMSSSTATSSASGPPLRLAALLNSQPGSSGSGTPARSGSASNSHRPSTPRRSPPWSWPPSSWL